MSTDTTRLLVTGSRNFSDQNLVSLALTAVCDSFLLKIHKPITLINGGAQGLDALAFQEWKSREDKPYNAGIKTYFAQWDEHTESCPRWDRNNLTCKLAGHRRNAEMLATHPDLCLAFPLHTQNQRGKRSSRGTWNMAEQASKAGVPTLVVWKESVFPFGQPAINLFNHIVKKGRVDFGPYQSLPLKKMVTPF